MIPPGIEGEAAEEVEPAAGEAASADDGSIADHETSAGADETVAAPATRRPRHRWSTGRTVTFGVLPALLLLLAVVAGYLKYEDGVVLDARAAAISSVRAASDGCVAILTYTPENAQDKLMGARDLLTGSFRESYTSLINDVVIPGSKQKRISATATVPAASSVSATGDHAVVLVFVDQTIVVGEDAPSATASAVQVTLDKIDDRWLISGFDPK